jgi:hypothetical protein
LLFLFYLIFLAYEIKIADEDSDEKESFEMPALSDKLNVCKAGYDAVSFIEKNISTLDAECLNNKNILGSSLNDSEIVN